MSSENFREHFEQLWGGDAFPGEVGTSEEECGQKHHLHSTAMIGIAQLLVFHQLNLGRISMSAHRAPQKVQANLFQTLFRVESNVDNDEPRWHEDSNLTTESFCDEMTR